MAIISPLNITYAVDEDVANRCGPSDFDVITARSSRFASGTDGAFASGTPWVLTAGSSAWASQGIQPGMVVRIAFAGSGVNNSTKIPPDFLAVDTVASNALTLRRLGQPSAIGLPPGPSTGATGITYSIASLNTQIESASYEINHRVGLNELIPGRQTANLQEARELNQATVLTVLARQFYAMARAAGDKTDDLWAKANYYAAELDSVLDRLIVHWKPVLGVGTLQDSVSSRFGTRLSR